MVPTPAGLELYELLRGAAPALVDPGTTAFWEMRLDDVVVGKADFRAVIDEIAGEADRLITVLRQHNGSHRRLEPAGACPYQTRALQGGAQEPRWRACSGHHRCGDTQEPPAAQREERLATTDE